MRLYLKCAAMALKGQMQYPFSFLMVAFGQFLSAFSAFLGVYFMFSRFHEVDGFTFPQVLLCYAAVMTAFALAEMFAHGFDVFPRMLGNGQFDRALVRPRSVVFQVLAADIDFTRLGLTVQAFAVFCYAIPNSGVLWTWDKILTLCLMVLCGGAVFFGLFLVYAAFTFFTMEGLEFMNILTYGGREFGRYPFAIYGDGILKFLTYVIPLALFQYYPFLYLLGREQSAFFMFTPLLGLPFLIPAYAFFRFGLRRYKSTGS